MGAEVRSPLLEGSLWVAAGGGCGVGLFLGEFMLHLLIKAGEIIIPGLIHSNSPCLILATPKQRQV